MCVLYEGGIVYKCQMRQCPEGWGWGLLSTWIYFHPSMRDSVKGGMKLLTVPKLLWLHKFRMDKWFHPAFYNGCNYLSMLGLKLNHVSKRAPGALHHIMLCDHSTYWQFVAAYALVLTEGRYEEFRFFFCHHWFQMIHFVDQMASWQLKSEQISCDCKS